MKPVLFLYAVCRFSGGNKKITRKKEEKQFIVITLYLSEQIFLTQVKECWLRIQIHSERNFKTFIGLFILQTYILYNFPLHLSSSRLNQLQEAKCTCHIFKSVIVIHQPEYKAFRPRFSKTLVLVKSGFLKYRPRLKFIEQQ